MKKNFWVWTVLLILSLCSLPVLWSKVREISYAQKQRRLADMLGVNLEEYRKVDFPRDYFAKTLTAGMSITEVHSIIKGYDLSLKCGDWAEVYYYFGTNNKESFRYKILYDGETYDSFLVDDIYDSMKISVVGCVEGLLDD